MVSTFFFCRRRRIWVSLFPQRTESPCSMTGILMRVSLFSVPSAGMTRLARSRTTSSSSITSMDSSRSRNNLNSLLEGSTSGALDNQAGPQTMEVSCWTPFHTPSHSNLCAPPHPTPYLSNSTPGWSVMNYVIRNRVCNKYINRCILLNIEYTLKITFLPETITTFRRVVSSDGLIIVSTAPPHPLYLFFSHCFCCPHTYCRKLFCVVVLFSLAGTTLTVWIPLFCCEL